MSLPTENHLQTNREKRKHTAIWDLGSQMKSFEGHNELIYDKSLFRRPCYCQGNNIQRRENNSGISLQEVLPHVLCYIQQLSYRLHKLQGVYQRNIFVDTDTRTQEWQMSVGKLQRREQPVFVAQDRMPFLLLQEVQTSNL